MRRRDFALLLPAAALAQKTPSADPILRAMQDEMARCARPLGVIGGQPLYYIECALDDAKAFRSSASLGALFTSSQQAFRAPRVSVRLGDKKFDNTNYVFSEAFLGTRFDPDQFPLDNNIPAMRQVFWLALDRAYKTAIEAIGRKRAALRNITQPEEIADFSDAAPVKLLEPIPNWGPDESFWNARIVALSRLFAAYPEVYTSSVDFESSRDTYYFANTDGAEMRTTELLASIRVRANGQAPDGMRLRDHENFLALDLLKLPSEAEMTQRVKKVGDNVRALAAAPVADNYSGPVLFEAEAAAQLFSDLIGSQATVFRKPVGEPGRPMNLPSGEFDGRLNSRVLPSSFTVVDDPTQKEYKGRPLMGHFPADLEGVKPEPVVLIEKGNFKAYLSTRVPTRDTKTSNGHARLPGGFGGYVASMSNLFIKSDETVSPADLKKKFIDLLKQRNKPFGILVRKLDFPSTASFDELRQLLGGGGRPAPPPLLAYRVYADGREELVRGLRFRGLNVRALKDIVAVGSDEVQFDYIANAAPFSIVGGGNYVFGCSTVAPGILFDDLELERPQVELPKLPLVPAPTLTA